MSDRFLVQFSVFRRPTFGDLTQLNFFAAEASLCCIVVIQFLPFSTRTVERARLCLGEKGRPSRTVKFCLRSAWCTSFGFFLTGNYYIIVGLVSFIFRIFVSVSFVVHSVLLQSIVADYCACQFYCDSRTVEVSYLRKQLLDY